MPSNLLQKGIFERVIQARNGVLVRVRFEVVDIDGVLKGRILGYEPIIALSSGIKIAESGGFSPCILACPEIGSVIPLSWAFEKKTTSPFSIFDFLTSIRARAPTK